MGRRLTGVSPLAYMGVRPSTPAQEVLNTRRPTVNDFKGFELGDWWIVPKKSPSAPASDPTREVWVLMAVREGVADWKKLGGGSGPVQVEVIGAGGGGGCAYNGPLTPVGPPSNSVAGNGGSYCKSLYTNTEVGSSQVLIVGAGGSGGLGSTYPGNAANGADGGSSSFGSLMSAGGGYHGAAGGGNGDSLAIYWSNNFTPGVATGGNIINIIGSAAEFGQQTINFVQQGASSFYGIGGFGGRLSASLGNGFGSSASGVTNNIDNSTIDGLPGQPGLVIITEYVS